MLQIVELKGARRTATETLPTVNDSVEAGARIGKYTLIAKVGHGGMAEVFLAAIRGPADFTKLCVLKRLHPHLESDPALVGMFLDEARLAARLSHPNVVQTYEVADTAGSRFLTMEYLEGQPLSRVLNRLREIDQKLPLSVGVQIFIDALDGLHYAHMLRDFDGTPLHVVHRDVSPSNIFLTYDGQVKVLDFGIAKAGTQLTETQAGQVKGKFAYIAPEQAQPGPHDHRVDVWSIGVVMWEAFAGRRLFKGDSEVATLHNAMTAEVPLLDEASAVPLPLSQIVHRALHRDPDLRYQSARQMKEDLEDFMVNQGLRATRNDTGALATDLFERERDEQHRVLSAYIRGEHPEPPEFEDAETGEFSDSREFSGARIRSLTTAQSSASKASTRLRPGIALVFLFAAIAGALLAFWLAVPRGDSSGAAEPELSGRMPSAAQPAQPDLSPTSEAQTEPANVEMIEIVVEGVEEATTGIETGEIEVRVTPSRAQRRRALRRARVRAATPMEQAAPMESATVASPEVVASMAAEMVTAPAAMSAVEENGFLTLDTVPWANVSLNGRALGTTPVIRAELPAGAHVLTLENPERGIRTNYRVVIRPGETTARRVGIQ